MMTGVRDVPVDHPPPSVPAAFGVRGEPIVLPGGQGVSVRVVDAVLKPADGVIRPPRSGAAFRPDDGTEPLLSRIPATIWTVPYAGSRFPGSAEVAGRPGLAAGANCQLFAYGVLEYFGRAVPPLRSSDLWDDTAATVRVPVPRPLDLLLFNAADSAYGAHVGVWVGDDQVLHLCAEVGRPAVWSPADFAKRERYRVLIGAKRVLDRPGG